MQATRTHDNERANVASPAVTPVLRAAILLAGIVKRQVDPGGPIPGGDCFFGRPQSAQPHPEFFFGGDRLDGAGRDRCRF